MRGSQQTKVTTLMLDSKAVDSVASTSMISRGEGYSFRLMKGDVSSRRQLAAASSRNKAKQPKSFVQPTQSSQWSSQGGVNTSFFSNERLLEKNAQSPLYQ